MISPKQIWSGEAFSEWLWRTIHFIYTKQTEITSCFHKILEDSQKCLVTVHKIQRKLNAPLGFILKESWKMNAIQFGLLEKVQAHVLVTWEQFYF